MLFFYAQIAFKMNILGVYLNTNCDDQWRPKLNDGCSDMMAFPIRRLALLFRKQDSFHHGRVNSLGIQSFVFCFFFIYLVRSHVKTQDYVQSDTQNKPLQDPDHPGLPYIVHYISDNKQYVDQCCVVMFDICTCVDLCWASVRTGADAVLSSHLCNEAHSTVQPCQSLGCLHCAGGGVQPIHLKDEQEVSGSRRCAGVPCDADVISSAVGTTGQIGRWADSYKKEELGQNQTLVRL